MDERLSSYPDRLIFVQCFDGAVYDCYGQPVHYPYGSGPCPEKGSYQVCLGCNEAASVTCERAFPDCLSNLRCPDAAPHCNAKTGQCSVAPAT